MIEINLVPENLRKKKKRQKKSAGRGFSLPKTAVVGMIGGFLILLICIHVVLQFFIAFRLTQHQELKKEWDGMQAAKQNVDVVITELRSMQNKIKAVKEVTEGKKILWAQKLNEISDALPRGVWLQELSLMEGALFMQGSSVSKNNSEILQVHKLTSNLKNDENFNKDFNSIEMGIHKTHKIGDTSTADFSVDAVLEK